MLKNFNDYLLKKKFLLKNFKKTYKKSVNY